MKGLLFVLAVGLVSQAAALFGGNAMLNKVLYKEMRNFVTPHGDVDHMEEDLYRKGNVLFVDNYSLKTTDGTRTQLVIGSQSSAGNRLGAGSYARFNDIYGFYQVNRTHVIVADFYYHCLKVVNRLNNRSYGFAGYCGSATNRDGRGTSARFYYPRSVIEDRTNTRNLVVLQGTGSSYAYLRTVDLNTRYVRTVVSSGLTNSWDMVWSTDNRSIYITSNSYYIYQVNWATKRATTLAGSSSASTRTGMFNQVRFSSPRKMIRWTDNFYILADYGFKRLTVLDMVNKKVLPLCAGQQCTLNKSLQSVLLINGTLYVGFNKGIAKLTNVSCGKREDVVYIKPFENTKTLTINAAGHTGEFPAGEYQFNMGGGSCRGYTLKVLKSTVIKRVAFKASYSVRCDVIANNSLGKAILEPILLHKMSDFQDICRTNCKMSATLKPIYTCTDNTLIVTWPTDTAYGDDIKQVPSAIDNMMKERLLAAGKRKAELPILNNQPQLVLPKTISGGRYVQVTLHNTETN